ncbi:armadillo-type protein [Mycena sp. CBHHK59/15]|nr:armadillo-type protein [Mycena sp. CBHHK59/15]
MQPLKRWTTRESTQSWWSDSNPPGATIQLHTFAKPLMKRMYQQQISRLIAKNRGSPLSKDKVEVLMSYLGFKYIWASTKALILRDLAIRVSKGEAREIVQGNGLPILVFLLDSSNPEIQVLACDILADIAYHRLLNTAVERDLGPRLASLLEHNNLAVRKQAIYTLANINLWSEGAAVEADTCLRLAALLWHDDMDIRQTAIYAMACISRWPGGASAIVNAKALHRVRELLQSPDSMVQKRTCEILGKLGRHESLNAAILELEPCVHLVSLLRNGDKEVRKKARYALDSIAAGSEEGARVVAGMKPFRIEYPRDFWEEFYRDLPDDVTWQDG